MSNEIQTVSHHSTAATQAQERMYAKLAITNTALAILTARLDARIDALWGVRFRRFIRRIVSKVKSFFSKGQKP